MAAQFVSGANPANDQQQKPLSLSSYHLSIHPLFRFECGTIELKTEKSTLCAHRRIGSFLIPPHATPLTRRFSLFLASRAGGCKQKNQVFAVGVNSPQVADPVLFTQRATACVPLERFLKADNFLLQSVAPHMQQQQHCAYTSSAAGIALGLTAHLARPHSFARSSEPEAVTGGPAVAASGDDAAAEVVQWLVRHLAPAYILHSRTFAAACGIAFHGTEPITRLCCGTASPPGAPVKCIFQVGSHIVFEPPVMFCSCASFRFQVANRQDALVCKHILALAIHSSFRQQRVEHTEPVPDVQAAEENPLPRNKVQGPAVVAIRDKFLTPEEFVAATCVM